MVAAGTRYGLRFVVELARSGEAGTVDAANIAARRGIPEAYLRKIAATLRRARIVEAERGQAGGYRLGRPSDEIRVLDIFDALETPASSLSARKDPSDEVWDKATAAFRAVLAEVTLADLAASEADPAALWII
jgi:Rrf2 family protein